jgi:hypothetical protein
MAWVSRCSAWRRRAGAPPARHLQHPAKHTHRVSGPLRMDESELHVCSFAKKAAAFFKISRSIRSCLFSRRSRVSSSRSAVVGAPAGPCPASISACFTQWRNADSVRSRSFATSAMLRLVSRIRRTVSDLRCPPNRGRSTCRGQAPAADHRCRCHPPACSQERARHRCWAR